MFDHESQVWIEGKGCQSETFLPQWTNTKRRRHPQVFRLAGHPEESAAPRAAQATAGHACVRPHGHLRQRQPWLRLHRTSPGSTRPKFHSAQVLEVFGFNGCWRESQNHSDWRRREIFGVCFDRFNIQKNFESVLGISVLKQVFGCKKCFIIWYPEKTSIRHHATFDREHWNHWRQRNLWIEWKRAWVDQRLFRQLQQGQHGRTQTWCYHQNDHRKPNRRSNFRGNRQVILEEGRRPALQGLFQFRLLPQKPYSPRRGGLCDASHLEQAPNQWCQDSVWVGRAQ